jgi:hypothetical protein
MSVAFKQTGFQSGLVWLKLGGGVNVQQKLTTVNILKKLSNDKWQY